MYLYNSKGKRLCHLTESRFKKKSFIVDLQLELQFNFFFHFIVLDMSEDLLQYYANPVILNHTGGHFIPASSAQKKTYLEFLESMRR